MTRKPGRPPLHPDDTRLRRLYIVATDSEWETILAALPSDARERATIIAFQTRVTELNARIAELEAALMQIAAFRCETYTAGDCTSHGGHYKETQ